MVSAKKDIIRYLKSEIAGYDLVLVSDFGHGLITNKIKKDNRGILQKNMLSIRKQMPLMQGII